MRILFVGGGSVGHVAPSVAVWRAIEKREPESEAHFLCANRKDEVRFLEKEQLAFTTLPLPRRSPCFPLQCLYALIASSRIIRKLGPDVIFSKGGAFSIAPCFIAQRRGIPIILHESDAVMGRANRLMSRWAKVVCLGFPPRRDKGLLLSPRSSVPGLFVTGNPIRPEISRGSRAEGFRLTGFSGTRPILLVLGGSQGAKSINEAVWRHLNQLLHICDVVHVTGRNKGKAGERENGNGYWAADFVHEELLHLYAITDLALTRAGAGVLSELSVIGIPAIIVPIRGLANDHQRANAETFADAGAGILLDQEYMHTLANVVRDLMNDKQRRTVMSRAMKSLSESNAAARITEILFEEGLKLSVMAR